MITEPDRVSFTSANQSFWKRFAGVSLAERYRLKELLDVDEGGAWYRASVDPGGERVLVRLMADDGAVAAGQLEKWERIARLSHPALLELGECGRVELDGEPFVFAAYESADESAEDALSAGGTMTEEEAREVLLAVSGALHYLHQNGWVHAAVRPEQIVAAGDRVKLTSDPLREESPKHTAKNDVWDLGATVYRLLTGQRVGADGTMDLGRIPAAFRPVVQDALRGALPLDHVEERLTEPAEEEPPAVEPVAEMPEPPVAKEEHPVVVPIDPTPAEPIKEAVEATPVTAAVATGLPEPAKLSDEMFEPGPPVLVWEGEAKRIPVWVYPAAAAVVLVGIFAAVRKPDPGPPVATYSPGPAPLAVPAAPPATAPIQPAATPPATAAAVQEARAADRSVVPERQGRPFWRVIAYTYARRESAEARARAINQRWRGLEATVFTPRGSSRPPFLVALGGRMSREEAARLQRKARSNGLPRDTFIRNYAD